MTLRTTLLLLGSIALVAVYLLSRYGGFRPGARNRRRSLSNARAMPRWPWQGRAGSDEPDAVDSDRNDVTLEDSELPALGLDDESFEDDVRILPPIRRDDEVPARPSLAQPLQQEPPKRKQMELAFSDTSAPPTPRPHVADREELLVLYLRTEPGRQLTRNELVEAMNQVGMRFGDMNIYHHYGVGSMPGVTPVFSIANMHEPGHLDVHDPAFAGCHGLAMFLQLPGPCDGPVAVELFLGAAQKLAQIMRLQLLNQEHRPLSTGAIDEMRARAARFGADID